MSLRRKIALSAAAVFVLLIAALALAPLLLRDRIEARVKRAISSNIDAQVDWRRLDLGLLRTFPNLSLKLHDLVVVGVGQFAGDTLISVPRFGLVLDLGSVLGSLRGARPLVVRSIELNRPLVQLRVRADGAANWDILRERAAADSSRRSLDVSLKRLDITDAVITFDNRQSDLSSRIAGLQHSLSGDFGKQRFTLRTRTTADTVSVAFAGVPYLSSARVEAVADLAADMAARTFTLRENSLRVNALQLNAQGSVTAAPTKKTVNVVFEAPRTDFKEILSLVPAIFTKDYETLQTSGTMSVRGRVRGTWGNGAIPGFTIAANIENGSFRYPDLPLPARDIFLRLMLNHPGGDIDSTVLNISRFHAVLGSDPIDGLFMLRTPKSDPDVGLRVAGRLDLSNLPKTVKLEKVQRLAGMVVANAAVRARLSDINRKQYDRVSANGTVEIRQLVFNAADLRQPLDIEEAKLTLSPRQAELSAFRGSVGSSDLTMTGSLENVLGFVLGKEDLRGTATLASHRFDLNEWRSDDKAKTIVVPPRIDFTLRAAADTVRYGILSLRNTRGTLRIKDQRATLEDFKMNVLGGELGISGSYETRPGAPPAFDLAVDLANVVASAAFAEIRSIQAFAPVARYADGNVSAQMKLNGELGTDMMPVLENITGLGSLLTSSLVLRDFPPLERLADALKLQQLRDPGFKDLKSSFAIEKGRLHVKPFDVRAGPLTMTIAVSNGIDQSLDYDVALRVPRSILGGEANRAVTNIINRSQQAGFNLQSVENITLGVTIGGTVTNPSVGTTFRNTAGDAGASVAQALREEAEQRQQLVVERVDSAAEEARRKVLAEAETRAAAVRTEAAALADKLRREGHERADSLETQGSGLARIAARAAADKLRKETDAKADAIVREAESRAQALLAEARQRADLIKRE
ncbi:MAG TPA: AsmA-like C-terminal region-containing protein [Longimicrobiales bacterium]|nr:AsmA-like C-terminal region-containing protein [Longimicrobiales bacterium]